MLAIQPRKLFLIDSIGAFTTLLFLLIIRQWNEYFGMPPEIMLYLAVVAAAFCLYSLFCFLSFGSRWPMLLKGIATANLLYCLATFILTALHFDQLTLLAVAYFAGEMMIICALVYVEFKTASAKAN